MNTPMIALTSLGVGAGLMYFADPQGGKRRRALVRDAVVHASQRVEAAARTTSRDVENRFAGLAARAQASVVAKPVTDVVLAARVRSRLGRLVSHPGAIEVRATSPGRVALSGPVFEVEVEQLLDGVYAVPGVTHVDNALQPHADAANVPGLQGPGPLDLNALPPAWARWTPTTRLMAGAAGLALMTVAARRRTIGKTAVGLVGFELLEQALRGARTAA